MKHHHPVGLLLSCSCLLLCAFAPVRADTRREAEALLKWKASLARADESLGPWSLANSTNLCRWTHITCDSAGHIRELRLVGTTLEGTLDELDFSAFAHLRELNLNLNGLYGTIPVGIGNLTSLTMLQISTNQDLRGTIPRSIGKLKHLVSLYMTDLGLDGTLPEEIGGALSVVSAGYNGFTGIYRQTFQNCTTLQEVDFTANNIVAELSDCFSEHPGQLITMAFRQNQLHGTLLTDRGEEFLCNSTDLVLLDLSDNALHGGLSKCFWELQSLEFMDLSSNSFSGVFPSSMTCGDDLRYLLLGNNKFTGTFPLGLKKCKNLTTLDLGGNKFSGTIPSWVSMSLPELNFLRLSSNMFDGIIPHEILQFRQLQVLDLSKNKLTGPIPDDFRNFTGMAQEQQNTDFTDYDKYSYQVEIHIVWKNVDHVYNLKIVAVVGIDLSGNSLTLEIPNGLTTLGGVRYLNLSGNHLSGCIPADIGNMVLLEALDLSRNQLSGKIPQSLAALKSISVLNFSSNSLSGRIPTGDQLRTLTNRSIYSNNPGLCGFPLEDCINSSTPAQIEKSLDEDREALWLYCFVAAGFIFGFWLYWGIFLFRSETWRCAFYQYVDNMQGKVTKKVYSCISRFWAGGSE
uniref:Leucine-rich repeat-containing N-terminal plant-type domain-containing protein n=1 Tax=Triticum aestivum TaxID=4565 RepID=A0A077S6P4_WHEAT|nr:unnamed protein product [Triticum aestivum]